MVSLKKIVRMLLKGQRRTAVFALTTLCNCKCLMCDMHRQKPQIISAENAKIILDFLSRNRFFGVYFTGGEPTLHPKLVEIVGYADKLGLATSLTTNGTPPLNLIEQLKVAGLYLMSVSLDHWDPSLCDEIRGYRDIQRRQEEIIEYGTQLGLKIYALAYLNPFLIRDGVANLVKYVNQKLRVPFGFCYPTKCDVNSYRLGGSISSDTMERQLLESIEQILQLKRNGYQVANVGTYIEDVMRFRRKEPPNFYCKGGEDVVYIDWSGNVYPCFLKEKLFNVLKDENPHLLRGIRCNDCLINCFREPSVLPQFFSSPRLLIKEALYSYSVRNILI